MPVHSQPTNLAVARSTLDACPHLVVCPGCPRFGDFDVPAEAQRQLREFASTQQIAAPQFIGAPHARYRYRARLAVRGRADRPKLGLFEAGSHQLVDIPRCSIHHPLINEVAGELRDLLRKERVPPYSDTAHAGLLRYVQIVVARRLPNGASGEGVEASRSLDAHAQLTLIANSETKAPLERFIAALEQRLGPRLHSLFFNANQQRTNTILGPHFERISGPDCLRDEVGGASVFYPPGAFGQASPELFDAIVKQVHGWVPEGARVTELFCGVGAIGLGLVARASEVCFNERSAEGLQGLQLGVASLSPALRSRVTIEPGAAEALNAALSQDSIVIVDPPRRGLDATLVKRLCDNPVQRLVYVSCGLDSFLRDAEQLSSRYRCEALSGYALFPFTEHVETVACFERRA